MTETTTERPASSMLRRLSAALYRRPRLVLGILLTPPILWLVVVYLGSLAVMFVSSLWRLDPATTAIVREPSLANFQDVFSLEKPYLGVGRAHRHDRHRRDAHSTPSSPSRSPTTWLASRRAGTQVRPVHPRDAAALGQLPRPGVLVANDPGRRRAFLNWTLGFVGLSGPGPLGDVPIAIVFTYIWLPYMILPLYAGLERIPNSLVEASSDLGGRAWTTFRRVVLPLAFPGLVAGSIFTFSLTLGDYITPTLVLRRPVHRQRRVRPRGRVGEHPVRGRVRDDPGRSGRRLPRPRAPARRVRGALTMSGRLGRIGLRIATALTLLFLYVPIAHHRRSTPSTIRATSRGAT